MFEDSKSKVLWFVLALSVISIVSAVVAGFLVDMQEFFSFFRSIERY